MGQIEAAEARVVLSQEHRTAAREIAQKSMVLLKNENILPFKSTETVAIIGPAAPLKDILGAWSWQGKQRRSRFIDRREQSSFREHSLWKRTIRLFCANRSSDQ